MSDAPFHGAANIFPLMEGDELDSLADDIKQRGMEMPIELLDGKIIDGRNRYRACLLAGIDPDDHMIEADPIPDDPIAYVLSLNLHRRHLSVSQAAMCAQRARKMYDEAAKERQKRKPKDSVPNNCSEQTQGDTRDQVGKAFGVSGGSVDRARRVVEKGIPEIADAVDAGDLTVYGGAKIAAAPKHIQKDMLDAALTTSRPSPKTQTPEEDQRPTNAKGKGIIRANEAINCLSRIPRNDEFRKRGFQIVSDWIKANK